MAASLQTEGGGSGGGGSDRTDRSLAVIRALPPDVRHTLRSLFVIYSPAQAVEELILNSLDAGATRIEISVDFERTFSFSVRDNGSGLTASELAKAGTRYHTSKIHSLSELEAGVKTFGWRGEALASLCDIALVSITSSAASAGGSVKTVTRVIRGGKQISFGYASSLY